MAHNGPRPRRIGRTRHATCRLGAALYASPHVGQRRSMLREVIAPCCLVHYFLIDFLLIVCSLVALRGLFFRPCVESYWIKQRPIRCWK